MKVKLDPILNGTRFMQLMVNECLVFRDSLFHLTSSLASLAKAFDLEMEKGHFPHLFSTLENLEYSGPIPPKHFFDLRYSRSESEISDFHKWHDEWAASDKTWNYRDQRKLYCKNDVEILKSVAMKYHYGLLENLDSISYCAVSPWFFPTMAGHMHKICSLYTSAQIDPKKATPEEAAEFTQNNAAVLEPMEHYFVKLSMRGGITNIFKYNESGKIHYQDIQSSYPSVQLDNNNLYPVGTPGIEIHDLDYYPCSMHFENPMVRCNHTLAQKKEFLTYKSRKSRVSQVSTKNLHDYCKSFFGYLVVDIIPNSNRYHQTIQVHDGSRVMPTCRKVFQYPVFSEMLKYEISKGAIVTKIYRADRYNSRPSPWNGGPLSLLYKCKMENSKKINPEDYARITQEMELFSVDCSNIAEWSKNKVRKQIAKGIITAAWGKHAESVDHPQSSMMDPMSKSSWNFYDSLLENKMNIIDISTVGGQIKFDYKNNNQRVRPNLSKGYLPWASAVTSYGRIKLDMEMQLIDPPGQPPRMTMCDTDSVLYKEENTDQYRVPEGDTLGRWETEDFESENGGIVSFASLGPKSYIATAANGQEIKKLKGVSLSYAHRNLYTKELVISNIKYNANPSNTQNPKRLCFPQRNFRSLSGLQTADGHAKGGIGGAMTIFESLKYVSFRPDDIKGEFREDGQEYRVYPHGYTGAL